MKAAVLIIALAGIVGADHSWQHGIWRDVQHATQDGGSMSIPIGGTPPTTVAGVTIQGTAPTYFSFPMTVNTECVTIDGPDRMQYVACWPRRLKHVIVNDPMDFAVEGDKLYVKGEKKGEAFKLSLVKTIRIEAGG